MKPLLPLMTLASSADAEKNPNIVLKWLCGISFTILDSMEPCDQRFWDDYHDGTDYQFDCGNPDAQTTFAMKGLLSA